MNLRDQLKEILPDILPRNPAQAIKGTELIEMVKDKLKQDYSDATLRYHFSIMSCDPSSPIVKVEQGQGYYLRTTTIHTLNSARNMFRSGGGEGTEELVMTSSDSGISISRANKFRAVVQRHYSAIQQFPFLFEESFTSDAQANRWRVPDLGLVEWNAGEQIEDSFILDKRQLEVCRRVGQAPFSISAVKLRLELTRGGLLEDLYQCLAASEWANSGEIVVAASIDDPHMVEEIRKFSSLYGIGVTTFGLDADILDDMPEPAAIENLMPREFEAIQSLFQLRRYAMPKVRSSFDWVHVVDAARQNVDFSRFAGWISQSLLEERVITAREFDDLERSAGSAGSPEEFVA